jgi:hypothetical protein
LAQESVCFFVSYPPFQIPTGKTVKGINPLGGRGTAGHQIDIFLEHRLTNIPQ